MVRSGAYYALAALAVAAMGLQTAALRHVAGVAVHTTFITGMVTSLAEEVVAAARHDRAHHDGHVSTEGLSVPTSPARWAARRWRARGRSRHRSACWPR